MKKVNWKRRYRNLLKRYRELRDRCSQAEGREMKRQWDIETGRIKA